MELRRHGVIGTPLTHYRWPPENWLGYPRLKINFKTIHASKGLEADHVILLNADSGRTGFPSEIVDDPLLSLVSPEEEA